MPGRYIPVGPASDWWPLTAASPGARGTGVDSRGAGRTRCERGLARRGVCAVRARVSLFP